MPEQEKIISELQSALEWCQPEDNPNGSIAVKIWAVREALELLKEQEPVIPQTKVRHGEYPEIVHRCGECKAVINRHDKYCRNCGQAVKWSVSN